VRATSARPRSGLFVRTIVPNSQTRARQQWGRQIAADGAWLLEQIDTDPAEGWLARLPTVQALREVWGQECVADGATREPCGGQIDNRARARVLVRCVPVGAGVIRVLRCRHRSTVDILSGPAPTPWTAVAPNPPGAMTQDPVASRVDHILARPMPLRCGCGAVPQWPPSTVTLIESDARGRGRVSAPEVSDGYGTRLRVAVAGSSR
jgi:hypothetical protein